MADGEHSLLLTVQHTEISNDKINRVPLKSIGFNDSSSQFVTISSRKDIYVFDLNTKTYWCFDEAAKNCSCFIFECGASSILVGTKFGSIFTIGLRTGQIDRRLKVFDDRIMSIVTIPQHSEFFLCYSAKEASICRHSHDNNNIGQLQIVKRFFKVSAIKSILSNLMIQKIVIRPKLITNTTISDATGYTLAVLVNDDSLYIYENVRFGDRNDNDGAESNGVSIQLTKHIHPIERRDLHGRHLKNHRTDDMNNNDSDKPQPNFSTNLISDIEFNENGTELWISCKDSCLIVIDTNDWYVMKNVSPEDFPITQLQMLPAIQIQSIRHKSVTNFSIGHINAVDKLAFLTEYANDGTIDVQPFTPWKCASIKRFTCSPDCKILAVIQTDGTLKLYSIEYLMRQVFQMKFTPQPTQLDQICSKITENLKEFDKNTNRVLSRQRLLAILYEYGEYPSKYRQIIWNSLLKLPNNTITFCHLRENAPANCVKSCTRAFYIPDPQVRRNFQQILSALINWSQVLRHSFTDEDHFLPYFIFPFVKFIGGVNLMHCFEIIATILVNQCSLWFEFLPLLPANYLGLIENLIDHFSPELIEFYRRHSVDSRIFAWPLMRSAFTEILAEFQWFMLWDHIISQPAYFMIFIIVAFNCMQQEAIKRLKSPNEIRTFFNEPTTINMKSWLRQSYELMELCPLNLHPKQYIEKFICLGRQDHYHKILNYPADEFEQQSILKKKMQKCRESIHRRYAELEKIETDLKQQIVNTIEMNVRRERQRIVKLAHKQALIDAAKCTENQRQHLILAKRQLNNREVLMKILKKELDNRNEAGENEFEMILSNLDRLNATEQDETELLAAESSLRKRDIDLLLKECNL